MDKAREIADIISKTLKQSSFHAIIHGHDSTIYVSGVSIRRMVGTRTEDVMTYAVTSVPEGVSAIGPDAHHQRRGQLPEAVALNVEEDLFLADVVRRRSWQPNAEFAYDGSMQQNQPLQ